MTLKDEGVTGAVKAESVFLAQEGRRAKTQGRESTSRTCPMAGGGGSARGEAGVSGDGAGREPSRLKAWLRPPYVFVPLSGQKLFPE